MPTLHRTPVLATPLILLLLLAPSVVSAAGGEAGVPSSSAAAPLLLPVAGGGAAVAAVRTAAPEGAEIDPRAVRVDTELLATAPAALRLDLAPGRSLVAGRLATDRPTGGWLTWHGRIEGGDAAGGEAAGEITLTLHAGHAAGRIVTAGGELWSLRPTAGGHLLARLDSARLPGCGGVLEPPRALAPVVGRGRLEAVTGAAGPPSIGLLILHTPRARSEAGGSGPMETLVRHGLDLFNTALANSGNNARAVLHHSQELALPYTGSGGALHRLRDDPQVAALRDRWNADVVTLVVGRGEGAADGLCGIAFGMYRHLVGPQFAPSAYNLVVRDCYGPNLTFAHELGHTLGAFHEPGENSPPPAGASFPWSFGHLVDGSFRTIMAYSTSCARGSASCPRQTFFSNPDHRFQGHPTGVAGERDVRRTFSATAAIVAAFRSGGAGSGPATPGDLAAQPVSDREIELTWVDAGDDEDDFEVELRGAGEEFRQAAVVAADTETVRLADLDADSEYRFRVRARNSRGTSPYSAEATATTLPTAPGALSAEPLGTDAVVLRWETTAAGTHVVEVRSPASAPGPLAAPPGDTELVVDGLTADTPYSFRVRALGEGGLSAWSPEAAATTGGATGPCAGGDGALCLSAGRFEVRAAWRNQRIEGDHGSGRALPVPGSERTGSFWFFSPGNVELLVKVIDGGPVNGHFWHLYGALTDVEYWVTVRDTATGASRTYHNPPGAICGAADDRAFPSPGAAGAAPPPAAPAPASAAATAATGDCVPGPTTLCLLGGRFRAEVEWSNPRRPGETGPGRTAAGGGDRTGFFWFFRPDNLELAVKVLDGRPINGSYWVFWAGLSDVEYTLRVTDTVTGAQAVAVNPAFSLCGGADTESLSINSDPRYNR